MTLSPVARACAAGTVALAVASLALQFVLSMRDTGAGPLQSLWIMARFFTILTNALVAVVFAVMAVAGRRATDRLLGGLVLWIGAVGVVYHVLLAPLWDPRGLHYLADVGLHSAVPAAVFAWWLAFAGRDRLGWLDPLLWMIWPVAYLAYALTRGAVDGVYPYPFIDPERVSQAQLVWNVSRLMEAFLAGGYILVGLARLKQRLHPSRPSSSSR